MENMQDTDWTGVDLSKCLLAYEKTGNENSETCADVKSTLSH